jgi:hypothetical protein
MSICLSDEEIGLLLSEPKPCPPSFGDLKLRVRPGHIEREWRATGQLGSEFQVRIRQSRINPLDFSVILMHRPPTSTEWFRLRRYNGSSHDHRNTIEGTRLMGFHRHTATERYQLAGFREDAFAEASQEYGDVYGAFETLKVQCSFQPQNVSQPSLDLFE